MIPEYVRISEGETFRCCGNPKNQEKRRSSLDVKKKRTPKGPFFHGAEDLKRRLAEVYSGLRSI